MDHIENLLAAFDGMSGGALAVLVILGGFGLAAFAIYAVLAVAKERR